MLCLFTFRYAYISGSTTEILMSEPLDPTVYALYKQINTKFADYIPPNRSVGIEETIKVSRTVRSCPNYSTFTVVRGSLDIINELFIYNSLFAIGLLFH